MSTQDTFNTTKPFNLESTNDYRDTATNAKSIVGVSLYTVPLLDPTKDP